MSHLSGGFMQESAQKRNCPESAIFPLNKMQELTIQLSILNA